MDHVDSKDLAKPVALLAKMIAYLPLARQLVKDGLLEASRMRKLLGSSDLKDVVSEILMIVSELARMSEVSSLKKYGSLCFIPFNFFILVFPLF